MKTKLLKIISVMFILSIVFVLQKTKINFSKMYADTAYNVCAMSNFRLAGCDKYITNQKCMDRTGNLFTCDPSKMDKYVKVGDGTFLMDPSDATYYLNEIKELGLIFGEKLNNFTASEKENMKQKTVNKQKTFSLATGLHGWLSLNSKSSISGCKDLSGRTLFNECPTNIFRGGSFMNWLDQADLPIISSKNSQYSQMDSLVRANIAKQKREAEVFLRTQEEQKKYPDLKINRVTRVGMKEISNMPSPKFQTILNGDQIVIKWRENWADWCMVEVYGGVLPNQKTKAQANGIDSFSIVASGDGDVSISLSCYSKSLNKTSSCVENVYFPERDLAYKCYTSVTDTGWQPHQPLTQRKINLVDVEVENRGDYTAKYVEVRFVPAPNFYPLHLSGTYYSTTDCMPARKDLSDKEKAQRIKDHLGYWAEDNKFMPPVPQPGQTEDQYRGAYAQSLLEYSQRAKTQYENLLGQLNLPKTGQDGCPAFSPAKTYLKNIKNKSVQEYCLKDFVHWDKCEVARVDNFCSAVQVVAATHLIAQKFGLSGMSGCEINPRDWNAPCDWGPRTLFNSRWQSWAVEFHRRTTPTTSKVAKISLPYGSNITEIVDGAGHTFGIEKPQISFLNEAYVKMPNGSKIIEEIRPGEKKIVTFIVELPQCTHNCVTNNIQYGYWVALPHLNNNMDKNVWDNFYYKNDVHGVSSMVLDPVEFIRNNKLWELTLEEIWDTGIVITGNVALSY